MTDSGVESVPVSGGALATGSGGALAAGSGGAVAAGGSSSSGQGEGQGGQSFFAICRTLLVRAVMMYCIMSMFRRSPAPPDGVTTPEGVATGGVSMPAANMFANGSVFDLYMFVGESERADSGVKHLVWRRPGLVYGDWISGPSSDGIHHHRHHLATTETMRANGSLYWHVFIVRSGERLNTSDSLSTVHRCRRLTRFRRLAHKPTHNLLTGSSQQEGPGTAAGALLSHWHPNITVSVVHDFTGWSPRSMVPPLDQYVQFSPDGRLYQPIVFINDYWNLARDYMPLNESVAELPLSVSFQPIGLFKFQMYSSMAMRNRWLSAFTSAGEADSSGVREDDEEDQDSLKEALMTTSVYLVALTAVVSLLHSVFEFLAFKNDVQFWSRRDSLEGLSVRSVMFGVFQSVVVLLYVLDNETNTMIRISCFVGLLIELWKVGRVTDVSLDRERRWLGLIPRLVLADKGSYVESNTRQYDQMAFGYLSWLVFPLFVAYSVYSLLYTEHSGWYSFVLSMLYGFLLTFGFIMMTPQLFINYKLKSVAHLPWRMLTYKALNTFIDDIFAFVIRMPMMYRIGCLRDDIVFFIYLYQRYIYRVDPSRVNEFGFSQEMADSPVSTTDSPALAADDAEEKTTDDKKND